MNNREQHLLQMGFKYNPHQLQYELSKYDCLYRVEKFKFEAYTDHRWNIFIEDIKYDLETVKKQYYDDLKQHPAYDFAAKGNKKQLLDKYNALNSQYKEGMRPKLARRNMTEYAIRLEAQVNLLKELMNDK